MEDSAHFVAMLRERGIRRQWTDLAVREPEWSEERADGTRHFARRIPEHGNRWLRVIVNLEAEPPLRVTAFFDRRLKELDESQSRQEE